MHLKSRQSTEKEAMSIPTPHNALMIPPRKPMTRRITAFQVLKSGIASKVFLLFLFKMARETAKANQMETKPNFF